MERPPASALSQPGPHGYPMRFAMRKAGWKGLKVCGDDYKQPFRFVEMHKSRKGYLRQVLHKSAHKKDHGPALVSIEKVRPQKIGVGFVKVATIPHIEDRFRIVLHTRSNQIIEMATHYIEDLQDGHLFTPTAYRFTLATPARNGFEVFEWRQANVAPEEIKGIRKKKLPRIKTGDKRPPQKFVTVGARGYLLVRLTGRRCNTAQKEATPLGFTKYGEEIVASYADAQGSWRTRFFFQFWGSAARGELGEDFTHVAVATGSAIWQDEMIKLRRRTAN
ncbi:hypothetical protein VTK56DRAFT_2210 [Thermocarpiscus australiensis]